jgi:TonB-linked SusC/RagA family outer membrane protein
MKNHFNLVRKWTLLFLIVFTTPVLLLAQRTVSGRVVSAETNQPISGATVSLKGKTVQTVTDLYGNFKISVADNDKIIVTNIGFLDAEVAPTAATTISLNVDQKNLSEVVVTALGVKKEKKRLGFSVQEVKGADLIKAREPNAINGLVGKVAGLRVGAVPELLGAPNLNLRGRGNLLYVVDGVPVNSDTWNISPDDVETFSVLKGPVAAALYGQRGQNGAILITTKRGTKDKRGYSVEFNSSVMIENGFNAIPKVQDEYGPGDHGTYAFVNGKGGGRNDGDYDIWGPKFEGQLIPQYDGQYTPGTSYTTTFANGATFTGNIKPTPYINRGKDNLKRFLIPGLLMSNNVAVATRNEKSDMRFSFTHMYQKGIVPNTKLNSFNMNLSAGHNFTNKLRLESYLNYNRQFTPNVPDVQYGPNSMIYNIIIWGGADWDIDAMRNYWQPGKEGIQQIYAEYQRYNNPYFLVYEWLRSHYKNDVNGQLMMKYKFNNHLEAALRTNITGYDLFRSEKFPYSATSYGREEAKGDYAEDKRTLFENNTELSVTFNKDVLKDFNVKASAYGNIRTMKYNSSFVKTNYLNVPGVYSFANTLNPLLGGTFEAEMRVFSGYSYVDLGYKNFLFLTLTGRFDKLSTLPAGNDVYFYPSASVAAVISDMVKLPEFISFLKLKGGYAKTKGGFTQTNIGPASYPVGYGNPYQTRYDGPTYQNTAAYSLPLVYENKPGAFYTNTIINPDIQPEENVIYEAGADIRFIKNRIGIDATYFIRDDGPQIYGLGISQATGYSNQIVNGVVARTKGLEITVNAEILKNKSGLNWEASFNWDTWRRRLKEIYPGVTTLNNFYKVGDRIDGYYASAFARDPDGNIIHRSNGTVERYPVSQRLGFLDPDWTFGINQKFNYKNFAFSFQVDGRVGGIMENYIRRQTFRGGRHIETVQGAMGAARYQDYIGVKSYVGEGVVIASGTPQYDPVTGLITNYKDLTFAPNTTATFLQDYISRYYATSEGVLMDRTFAKLREVILSYNVPVAKFGKSWMKAATVSIVGRNLLYFIKKQNKDVDADQFVGGEGSTSLQTPTTKRYGININITF